MMDIKTLDSMLLKLHDTYTKIDEDTKYEKETTVATETELRSVETILECPIPPSLRTIFLEFSKSISFHSFLPSNFELTGSLSDIFSANFTFSTDELVMAENSRKSWVKECFSSPEDPYDKVWHNKLGFATVGNGDVIAFDLSDPKEDKRVVYLSHDDGEGHGYVLGRSFADYFTNLILIGACGNEYWQMMPFITDSSSGIDPDCDNANNYRAAIGLQW